MHMQPTESDEEYLQKVHHFEKPDRNRGGNELSNRKTGGDEECYDDEPEESISERLIGLSEMFPQPLRCFTSTLTDFTVASIKGLYRFSCNASWIFFTSSVILFAPVIFETERAQMEEMQKTQQKQVLLGPGSALSAVGSAPELPSMR